MLLVRLVVEVALLTTWMIAALLLPAKNVTTIRRCRSP